MSGLGEVLSTARRANGLSQEQLARRAGVTQAALSRYENDLREPDPEVLDQLAGVLGVTPDLLRHAGRTMGAMAVDAHMRRRATARATDWRRVEARLNLYRMHSSLLFEEVSLRADQRVPTLDPLDVEPQTAARMVRMQWRVPVGPVRSLTQWLEAAGCIVLMEDFGTSRIDGVSQWIDDHPVMLLNERAPIDRQRLTMAHELGHLVLHSSEITDEIEREANEFASEFLMPIDVIRPQLRNIKTGRLVDLKREWGVSMAALIEHAYNNGLVNAAGRTALWKTMSRHGWRIREPAGEEIPAEVPSLARDIAAALEARGLTDHEIARLAGYASPEHNRLFRTSMPALRVV